MFQPRARRKRAESGSNQYYPDEPRGIQTDRKEDQMGDKGRGKSLQLVKWML